jgi:hypothetical protein
MQMLFDKRCHENVKGCIDEFPEYREFARAVTLRNVNDQLLVCYESNAFHSFNQRDYESSLRSHQLGLSNNGIYGFTKYHVFTMLYEMNLVKPFINFAKTKGYSCAYTN